MARVSSIATQGAARALEGSSCAFGVFDGVHKGHTFLIEQACTTGVHTRSRSVVLTFDIDPDELFHPQRLRKLQDNDLRIETLASLGVDDVLVIPFTRELAATEPKAFLDRLFGMNLPAAVHVGHNFRFGAKAAGTVETMRTWAQNRAMEVHAHELVSSSGVPISSTRIRTLLGMGDVAAAYELLGRPYTVRGIVRNGRHDGRRLGFRTANLHLETSLSVLADGVYAGYAIVDGMRYRAAISMGVSRTFDDDTPANCEVHILDYSGNLYGAQIDVLFCAWLRPMATFANVADLVLAVDENIAWVRDNIPL